jgi:isoamylase
MYETRAGRTHPLGAVPDSDGVNFSLFSQHATAVELLLFDHPDDPAPAQIITLDPDTNRTYSFWHVYVVGLRAGAGYAYRASGPSDAVGAGHRFNPNKVLIDPYTLGVSRARWRRADACDGRDNLATAMRGVVIDAGDYDWEGDQPLNRPIADTIIYELHVGGFTRSPSAETDHPGTFAALREKIPYLRDLGITAVELMPIFDFDPTGIDRRDPVSGATLVDYWGYNPVGFFCPHADYCLSPGAGTHLREFRDLVKAFHRAGLEVILDVVFNHTTEGDQNGPTVSFRGLDNSIYYHLVPSNRAYYLNYSGCGNTVNCNHPVVEKQIVESLLFWVEEMHVDGFRFDEGSVLSRDEDGNVVDYPPVLWGVELSDALADTKTIAEAWDAGGSYQVGRFPGYRWGEWNGRYRDDVRRFVRGDGGLIGAVAARIAGSADIYQANGRLPTNSINFVTCHDGFTLNDLVSYNSKHNEANGEDNRDGTDNNLSANYGVEGPTDDPTINTLRERQIKNFATILFLSRGVPMLLGGDELRRSQAGNNNAYCQDNPINWLDWGLVDQHRDLLRFFQQLIGFRKRHRALRVDQFYTGETVNQRGLKDIAWHGRHLLAPAWDDPTTGLLAFTIGAPPTSDPADADEDLHVMLNLEAADATFDLPSADGRRWYRAIDTGRPAPDDILGPGAEALVADATYPVTSRSIVVLVSRTPPPARQR